MKNTMIALGLLALVAVAATPVYAEETSAQANASATSEAEATPAISIDDLMILKQIGFNEDQIKAELEALESPPAYADEDIEKLVAAEFSEEFVEFVRALAPARTITNDDIAAMLDEGKSPSEILLVIASSEAAFDTGATAMLELQRGRTVHIAVTKAMLAEPLTIEDLRLLARAQTSAEDFSTLIGMLGHNVELDDPSVALELTGEGVPASVLAEIRSASTPVVADAEPNVESDFEIDRFTHVTNLFTLAYPRSWFFTRYIDGDATLYQATKERPRGRTSAKFDSSTPAITARYWLRGAQDKNDQLLPEQLDAELSRQYGHILQSIEPVGEPQTTEVDGRPSAYRDYTASAGEEALKLRWQMIVGEEHVVALMMHAGNDAFATNLPTFEQIADASEISGSPFPERQSNNFTSSELASRYKQAVVAVIVSDNEREWFSMGTAFFVRGDGYLLTNDHVIYNEEERRPWRHFRIRWSNELDIDDERAQLIDTIRVESQLDAPINTGEDLALLKVDGIGPYDTIPLSPLDRTQVGDPIIAIGFPIASEFDRRTSTTISTGLVTRFNRDVDQRIETIITDAKIAPGNSGGPSVSLVTGGVVGINTRAVSQVTAQSESRSQRESVGYAGIMPIDRAVEWFPQVTTVSAERDQLIDSIDAYDLAKFAFQKEWRFGAMELARTAIDRAPSSAAARHLNAKILLTSHPDRSEDDIAIGERELERALSINGDFQEALFTKADFEIEREEFLEAIKAVNRSMEARETWVALTKRAHIYATMEQFDDALRDLERAKTIGALRVADPYIQAGNIYYQTEDFEKGREEFKKAVEISPSNIDARLGIGRYHLLTGKHLGALLEFDAIREDAEEEPDVHAAIGQTYARQGNYRRAVQSFDRAFLYYDEAERIPPEEVLAEAAETAADKLLDQRAGIDFYALYLGRYYESKGTLPGHRYLAERFPDDVAIRRAHLARAIELKGNTQDDERKELEEKLQPIRSSAMQIEDVRTMRTQRYPSSLIVHLIDNNPGNFSLAGTTSNTGDLDQDRRTAFAELSNELGYDVAVAIYFKVRARERAQINQNQNDQNQNNQGEQRNTVTLVGTWVREVEGRRAEIILNDDDSYSVDDIRDGQRNRVSQGTWKFEPDGYNLALTYNQNGQEQTVRYKLRVVVGATLAEDLLFLTQDGQEREYRRG